MFDIISQISIVLFGCTGLWLVARKDEIKKYGYILGICAQPFWIYETITNEQWGILLLTFFYTYSWGMGIYNYWIKK